MPGKRKKAGEENIESGMVVEATKGDLGEEDVSKPRVSAVSRNKDGEVEELTVQKGVIFRKSWIFQPTAFNPSLLITRTKTIPGKSLLMSAKRRPHHSPPLERRNYPPKSKKDCSKRLSEMYQLPKACAGWKPAIPPEE